MRAGSLREHIKFWEDIGASDYILKTLREGYKLPFRKKCQKKDS